VGVISTKKTAASGLLTLGLILLLSINFSAIIAIATTNDLGEVEIREYEGQDLSSVTDSFRENSIKGPQYIDNETYRLGITGLVNESLSYTYDEVINDHPVAKKVVTLYCVEGWKATILWEGVLIEDLLEQVEVSPSANTVIFHAYDGYTTSLPLSYVIENKIMIAYKMNNVTLPPERGFPFQLVAESKWGYKWIKWITEIELSNDPAHQGYWESRGYSNTGNLDEPFHGSYPGNYGDFVDLGDPIPEFPTEVILPLLITAPVVAILFRKKFTR
jgi:DMSO/TMAO reductase YedYZ molybdopterin-dependent catalytic subunit